MAARIDDHSRAKIMFQSQAQQDLIPAEGYTRPVSVGLKESELALLDEIAGQLAVARNAVMRYLIRDGLARLKMGQLEIPVERQTRNSIKMP